MSQLSKYELSCGYIQRMTRKDGATVTLWREHTVYHVRLSDTQLGGPVRILRMWQSFDKLTDARRAYRAMTTMTRTMEVL